MPAKRKDISIGQLAQDGIKLIEKSANSNDPVDKLVALNAVLTTLVFAFLFVGTFQHTFEIVSYVLYLFFGGLIGAGLMLAYLPLIKVIQKIIQKDYFAFNFSVAILFVTLAVSVVGSLSFQENYLKLAVYGLILQLVGLIFFGLLVKVHIKEKVEKAEPNSMGKLFWTILEKLSTIGGAIAFIILVLNYFGIK